MKTSWTVSNNHIFITKPCLLYTGPNIKGHFIFQNEIMSVRKCRVSDCVRTNNDTVLYSPSNEELHRTWKHLIDHTGREKYVSFHICAKHFSSSQFHPRYELRVFKFRKTLSLLATLSKYCAIHLYVFHFKLFHLTNIDKNISNY